MKLLKMKFVAQFLFINPLSKKIQLSLKIVTGIYKANDWAEEDTGSYVEFLYDHDLLSGDQQDGFEFIDSLNYKASEQQLEDTIKEIIDDYIELGVLEEGIDPEETLNYIWAPTGIGIEDVNGQ